VDVLGWAVALAGLAAGGWLVLSLRSSVFGPYPDRADRTDRVIALTFDDGPNEPYTGQIADLLARRGIRATFFQVGRCVRRHPESTARLVRDGHVIGNHSYSHRFHTYLVPGRFRREVVATQEVLRERLGRTPALVRTPWLWRQPGLLRMLGRIPLRPVAGTFIHAAEVFQPDGARMARRAVARARPGGILIFHDGFDGRGGYRGETVRTVELTADALARQGYRFVTVDELLGIPAYADAADRTEPTA
jgi:peptidoglycan/xylan/chitin deacetylase (PgdA/CDA1 family)